jgi:hypothetical protein
MHVVVMNDWQKVINKKNIQQDIRNDLNLIFLILRGGSGK